MNKTAKAAAWVAAICIFILAMRWVTSPEPASHTASDTAIKQAENKVKAADEKIAAAKKTVATAGEMSRAMGAIAAEKYAAFKAAKRFPGVPVPLKGISAPAVKPVSPLAPAAEPLVSAALPPPVCSGDKVASTEPLAEEALEASRDEVAALHVEVGALHEEVLVLEEKETALADENAIIADRNADLEKDAAKNESNAFWAKVGIGLVLVIALAGGLWAVGAL